jgi:hypothetical protein
LSVQQHLAAIWLKNAGQQFDQRTFASPVFTQQGEHLACVYIQRHIVNGLCATKTLAYVLKSQQRMHRWAQTVAPHMLKPRSVRDELLPRRQHPALF